MKALAFIIGLSIWIFSSCTDNLSETASYEGRVLLTGHTCDNMYASFQPSPGLQRQLPGGSRILVNASGSLQLSNKVFTYNGNQWTSEYPIRWEEHGSATQFTALYPVFSDLQYESHNLYSNDTLADILFIHCTYPTGKPIHLQFKHLFSQLTFRIAPELQKRLQKMEIQCPYTLTSIHPQTTQLTLNTQQSHTTMLTASPATSVYSLLVPPNKEQTVITLRMITSDQTYETRLSIQELQSNKNYTYTLKTSGHTLLPGIATIEDWIAFSKLIEHPSIGSYNGKKLSDFGTTTHGVTTYYLRNDLNFSNFENQAFPSISGTHEQHNLFSDVFDGQGHTLSNLNISPVNRSSGVFSGISNQGCVKNLHVLNSKIQIETNNNSSSQGVGILAGINYGEIDNCSARQCTILINSNRSDHNNDTGGLIGKSYGKVSNCYVHQLLLDERINKISSIRPLGGLIGYLKNGYLCNSYVSNTTIKCRKNYTGGLCGQSSNSTIHNCYVHRTNISWNPKKGMLIGYAENSNIAYNYFDDKLKLNEAVYNSRNCKENNNERYVNDETDYINEKGQSIEELLNGWIQKNASDIKGIKLNGWRKAFPELPAKFISPS